MKKLILFLMVMMIACVTFAAPAFACERCGINEKDTSPHAPIDQDVLVVTFAAVDSRSSGVLLSVSPEALRFPATNKMNITISAMGKIYKPGHGQLDYGEIILNC